MSIETEKVLNSFPYGGEDVQRTRERLQVIIASYFRYYGVDVAEMLELHSDADQRRITQMFMNIIEDNLYIKNEKEDTLDITIPVAKDIATPVRMFIEIYLLDNLAEETMKKAKESLTPPFGHPSP